MFLVHVYRPEADADYMERAVGENPFSGIELLAICQTEEEVNSVINLWQVSEYAGWKFHYEEVRAELLEAVGVKPNA